MHLNVIYGTKQHTNILHDLLVPPWTHTIICIPSMKEKSCPMKHLQLSNLEKEQVENCKKQPMLNNQSNMFQKKQHPPLQRSIAIMLEYPIYFAICILSLSALDSSILQGFGHNVQKSLTTKYTTRIRNIDFYGLNLLKVLIVGPLLSMVAVYLGFAFTLKIKKYLRITHQFILRNYSRLFVPFMIAQLCIQLGWSLLFQVYCL